MRISGVVERLKTQLAVRWHWKSPKRYLDAMAGFHATEADGVWHLHRSLPRIKNPQHRAIVFTHSLEEESHADTFARVYNDSSAYRLQPVVYQREDLYGPDSPGWKTMAFVHVGEVDATNSFRLIRKYLDEGPLASALNTIIEDEDGHIDLTQDMLLKMGASEQDIEAEYKNVRLRRLWEGWLRVGREVVNRFAGLQLTIVYYLAGPFLRGSARRKLTASIVDYDNNFVKFLARPKKGGGEKSWIMGISYGYHDASVCLVHEGVVIAAIAEERLTRQKHDPNFPAHSIEACLDEAGISINDIDQIVYHEDPHAKFSRVLTSGMSGFPHTRREFTNSMRAWIGKKLWSLIYVSGKTGVAEENIAYLSHHFSHAVQAFMGSGYSESAVLVVDAVGDWSSTAMFRAEWSEGVPKVTRVVEVAFPHSLGLVYSSFTAYLGFNPNDSECSTMALAAFGSPVFQDKVNEIVGDFKEEESRVDQSYFHFVDFHLGAVTERFIEEFGPARDARGELPFSSLGDIGSVSEEQQRFADIAASIQRVIEERILELAESLHEKVPLPNLCLAGGVSLNCIANYRLLSEGPFSNIHIPPDPGDGGTCIGSALYLSALQGGGNPAESMYGPYVGKHYDERDSVALVEHLKYDSFLPYLKDQVPRTLGVRWEVEELNENSRLCDEVALALMDRKIVGWYQGRFEIGPRALGNRSILIRPDDCELAVRLSRLVKSRAAYRPYAFSVAKEDAASVLDVQEKYLPFMKWMQYAVPIHGEQQGGLRAALHVDGTSRVQVCSGEDNRRFHQLLTRFGESFGVGAILNTSFNPSGYPIVTTPEEAMAMFARTGMDLLVLGNHIIRKVRS
jgi:carbamoyltransferase